MNGSDASMALAVQNDVQFKIMLTLFKFISSFVS